MKRTRGPYLHSTISQFVFCLWLGAILGSCGSEPEPSSRTPKDPVPAYVELGDLSAIKDRGTLRILSHRHRQLTHLPRQGLPQNQEQEMLQSFANSQGLQLTIIQVEQYKDLIPHLLEGKGDVIASNFSKTPGRKKRIHFSVPVDVVNEEMITRKNDTSLKTPSNLRGRTVTVRRSSAYWPTIQDLQSRHPGFNIREAPEHFDTEQLLEGVGESTFDLTVADSNILAHVQSYYPNVKAAFSITKDRPIAWGVRPTSQDLLKALNAFLNRVGTGQQVSTIALGDLSDIRARKTFRVLTRNNAATYFLWQGQLMGFEYELAKHFAKQQKMRVKMVVAPSRKNLIPWLLEGKADAIAASLTISEQRKQQGVLFSQPYLTASEILVTRTTDPDERLQHVQDLAGRTIAVRQSSTYWETVRQLQHQGISVNLVAAPEDLETEEIIAKVADGTYDLTVADSHILDIELTWRNDIRAAFPLGDPKQHGWAVRKSNPQLLQAINQYFQKEYRGLFYNITLKKYFQNPRHIREDVDSRVSRTGALSPYDHLAKTYAAQYGFDWRLIVAQMYQESRFNPKARSWAGALGLMQVLPKTAKSLGFNEVKTPKHGVEAGVKYLNWVRERFDPDLPVDVRIWFALAGYNAGPGHVHDAQRLARKLGMNPNRWFGHVEEAIKLLAKRKYARQARHGYCRGSEPAKYVQEIKRRYDAYQQAIPLALSPA